VSEPAVASGESELDIVTDLLAARAQCSTGAVKRESPAWPHQIVSQSHGDWIARRSSIEGAKQSINSAPART
jgi:hypothetical protein